MKTKPLIRRVIGLPRHRSHRAVDAPSLAAGEEGRHRGGLAEVFRSRFVAAMDRHRAELRNQLDGSGQSEM